MMGGNDASPVAASIPPSLAPPPFPASTAPPPPPEPPEPAVPALPAEPPAPPALVVPPPEVTLLVVVLPPVPPLPDVVVLDAVDPPALVALVVAEPPLPLVWDPVDPGRSEPASEQASKRAHATTWYDVAMANLRDVGGTRGGIGTFLIGLSMAASGGYLLLNQVQVHGGYFTFWGIPYGTSFGLSLLPILAGVFLLFVNGKSIAGWVLTVAGAAVVLAGILMSLQIYFQPTSLYNTLIILVLMFGGLGLIFRSLRAAA
jgi:hypothetical protein